ncbi:MAG: 5'-nucleotidase [Saprospiraceae bacterium]|nr:5'-nucleotidase [Saprospiraceae bacterium]
MPIDLSQSLVIGVSSRALFDLEEENAIFVRDGIEGYRRFQEENEHRLLNKGTAFPLVQRLLALNQLSAAPIVEVVVMSRNSPLTGVRIMHALRNWDLPITRMAFSGGEPLAPYLDAFGIDLFLSRDPGDVQMAIDSGHCAAAHICDPPGDYDPGDQRVKIAFDADAVLFSGESEWRYKTEGLDAFHRFEADNEHIPLNAGPFANLLIKLSRIQEKLPTRIELSPLRIAIVTARSAPSHMRVIHTLRRWGVYVDEAYFLGGMPKAEVLRAFGAQIFFDDQEVHTGPASRMVPTGKVPYPTGSPLAGLQASEIPSVDPHGTTSAPASGHPAVSGERKTKIKPGTSPENGGLRDDTQ